MRLLALLAALALLPGCMSLDDPPADGHPAARDAAAATMPVPVWRVGDWWEYASWSRDGVSDHTREEVVAVERVPGADAPRDVYRVRVTGNFTDSPREEYRDAATLNGAWHKWGDACGPLSRERALACTSGDRWHAWPLVDGATWDVFEGGDVIEGADARATLVSPAREGGGPVFSVVFQDRLPSGLPARHVVWSADVGNVVTDTRLADDGTVYGTRTLVAHGRL